MGYHAGLDWGGAVHAVCVVDEAGRIVVRFDVHHDAEGIAELITRLAQIAPAAEMPIAIERPSGLIVDALIEAGHPVVPIHPNVVKACRPRYRAAAGKSDPGDAYLLADILRTDGHRFRPLQPCSDEIKALRALVRARDDLVAERVALANRLRSLLDGFWPGAAAIFADVDRPSRSPSCGAIRHRTAPAASVRSAWPPSSPSTATAATARPLNCSPAGAPPPPAWPARTRPISRASSSARWPRC
jgi:hypothetical protein